MIFNILTSRILAFFYKTCNFFHFFSFNAIVQVFSASGAENLFEGLIIIYWRFYLAMEEFSVF